MIPLKPADSAAVSPHRYCPVHMLELDARCDDKCLAARIALEVLSQKLTDYWPIHMAKVRLMESLA